MNCVFSYSDKVLVNTTKLENEQRRLVPHASCCAHKATKAGRESQAARIRANIPPYLIDSRIQKEPNQREPVRLRVSPSELAADVRNGMPKKWLCAKYRFSSLAEASVDLFCLCVVFFFFFPS